MQAQLSLGYLQFGTYNLTYILLLLLFILLFFLFTCFKTWHSIHFPQTTCGETKEIFPISILENIVTTQVDCVIISRLVARLYAAAHIRLRSYQCFLVSRPSNFLRF